MLEREHVITAVKLQSHCCDINLSSWKEIMTANHFHQMLCKWGRQQVERRGNYQNSP